MILSLDPGLTIGVAKRLDNNEIETLTVRHGHIDWLCENVPQAKIVIVEQFQASMIDRYGLFTVELVGATCALATKFGVKLVRHAPVVRKFLQQRAHDFLRSRKIKFMIHEEDALAHLYIWEELGK